MSAREPRTDPTRSGFVAAGAGTGKTTLLLDRILDLLHAGTPVGKIVAITFSEKAAAEIRSRLRDLLGEDRDVRGQPIDRGIAAAALRDLERAPIATIHGFAATLLRENPFEAGVDPGFEIADPTRAGLLREEAWETWMRREFSSADPSLPATAEWLEVFRTASLGELRALAMELAANPDLDRKSVV